VDGAHPLEAGLADAAAATVRDGIPRGTKAGGPVVFYGMKGDYVEIVIDAGGEPRTYEVKATRAGRRVDVRTGRGVVEVSELTRSGTAVRTARFMASRVLALVEHPAGSGALTEERPVRAA
jgi:hypothetical protein